MTRQVATRQQSTAVDLTVKPNLGALERMVADPFGFDEGDAPPWQLPSKLPEERQIQSALGLLAASMQPCGIEFLVKHLQKLAIAAAVPDSARMDADAWKRKYAVYCEQLHEFPADIVARVCDEFCKTADWFPPVGKLFKAMSRERELRRRQIARLNEMLKAKREPAKQSASPLLSDMEPAERLRTMLATYRKVYGDQHARTIACERDLAKAEGREPEAWARNAA